MSTVTELSRSCSSWPTIYKFSQRFGRSTIQTSRVFLHVALFSLVFCPEHSNHLIIIDLWALFFISTRLLGSVWVPFCKQWPRNFLHAEIRRNYWAHLFVSICSGITGLLCCLLSNTQRELFHIFCPLLWVLSAGTTPVTPLVAETEILIIFISQSYCQQSYSQCFPRFEKFHKN